MTDDNLNNVFDDSNDFAEPEKEVEKETMGATDNKSDAAEAEESKADAEPPSAENKEEVWTKKAVLDERKKRQALENELAELKKAKPKDGEDEKPAELSLEDRLWQERTLTLREIFIEKHEDYEEMETVFLDMVKENPALATELRNSTNPVKFAYNQAKNYNESKKLSDPDYLQKIKEEVRKEVLAEIEAKQSPGDKRKKSALSVANLSKSTSVSSNSSKDTLETLDDMFDD